MTETIRRDLRTGVSPWETRRLPAIPHKPLSRSGRCDVLVIGAGISGAIMAEALAGKGLDTMVVDRRGPAKGSTAASTALVQYELDTPVIRLIRLVGAERARRMWQRSRLAVLALQERAMRLGIRADLETKNTLYLSGNLLDGPALEKECDLRASLGFEVSYLRPAEVEARFGIRRRHAILSFGNLSADPRRLTAGFLNAACARGARIHAPVDIVDVRDGRGVLVATTAAGQTIRAGHVVYATGYELAAVIPAPRHRIVSTFAIATAPQRRLWEGECLIWEASDPYLYLRTTPDGRVICGGGDEEFSDEARRDRLLPRKNAFLERRLGALMPWLKPEAAFAWTGSFGASTDGAPSIGEVPGHKRRFGVLGYGGNGITFSMLAAQIVISQIAGKPDTDAPLFAFLRR